MCVLSYLVLGSEQDAKSREVRKSSSQPVGWWVGSFSYGECCVVIARLGALLVGWWVGSFSYGEYCVVIARLGALLVGWWVGSSKGEYCVVIARLGALLVGWWVGSFSYLPEESAV